MVLKDDYWKISENSAYYTQTFTVEACRKYSFKKILRVLMKNTAEKSRKIVRIIQKNLGRSM